MKQKEKENCMNCTRVLNGGECPYQKDNDGRYCKYYHDVSNWV
jgi:RNA polymerase subunit RPABC4/transcription elongation factor Spt4